MVIITRFGTPVEILSGNVKKGEVDILCRYDLLPDNEKADPVERKTWTYELKADDGIKEINEAIREANFEKGWDEEGMPIN